MDPLEAGELGDSFVSGEAARRLSCDASVVEVIEDEHGVPISVGRKRRTISGALKRALHKRDTLCSYPGCTHRIFWRDTISSTGPMAARRVWTMQHCCVPPIIVTFMSTGMQSSSGRISGRDFAILTAGW